MKHALASVMLLSLFTACDDNEDNKPNKPDPTVVRVEVDYETAEGQLAEDKGSFPVTINFSDAAEGVGVIEVTVSGDAAYGTLYTTSPAAIDGKILLNVEEGDTQAQLTVVVTDNAKLNGHKSAAFSITGATGGVALGEVLEFVLAVKDDELLHKPQEMVKVGSVANQLKNTYEYNEDGQVTKIHWESKSPFGTTTGTDEYFYNVDGQITRYVRAGGAIEINYVWENGLMVRQERIQSEAIVSYFEYEYNANKEIIKSNNYFSDGVGGFRLDSYSEYAYHDDGNIHEITYYSFDPGDEVFVKSTVTAYDTYVEGKNPAPLELFPGHAVQKKLPTGYTRTSASGVQEYQVAYEFLEGGTVSKKTITGPIADAGVTSYTYFD